MDRADRFAGMVAGLQYDGMTVPDIADRSGLHRSTIYRIRAGHVRNPTSATVERLGEVRNNFVAPLRQKRV